MPAPIAMPMDMTIHPQSVPSNLVAAFHSEGLMPAFLAWRITREEKFLLVGVAVFVVLIAAP